MSGKIILSNVRLSFNSLFEPEDFDGDENFSYNAKVIIPKDSEADRLLMEAFEAAAEEAFGKAKYKGILDKIRDDKAQFAYHEYDEGNMVLATKRKAKAGPPVVVDRDRTRLTADDNKVYAGCYVNLAVRPWAMQGKGKYWVRAALEGCQFVEDGEAFGQRTTPDDFPDL